MDLVHLLMKYPCVVFKIPGCPNCGKLITLLDTVLPKHAFMVIDIAKECDDLEDGDIDEVVQNLYALSNTRVFPMMFMQGKYVGGYHDIKDMITFDSFRDLVKEHLKIEITPPSF